MTTVRKLLAFDTSTDACTVALKTEEGELAVHRIEAHGHAQHLLPMIDGLLRQASIQLHELDALVYGRGPGSFTGVRLAVAAAQGLSLSSDIKTLGLSTLAVLAQETYRREGIRDVTVALDARMGEIYTGRYQLDDTTNTMQACGQELVCEPAVLASHPATAFSGSGVERYAEHVTGTVVENVLPHALAMLELASAASEWQLPGEATPVYLRDKVALTEKERGVR